MNLYKQFNTDTKRERDGINLQYGFVDEAQTKPIQIRIARAGGSNAAYKRVLENRVKPYRRQIQNETLDLDTMTAIMREVYAETIVLGWNNVQDAEGNDMAFSKENVIKLFTDLPELFEDVQNAASTQALFRQETLEQEAKN